MSGSSGSDDSEMSDISDIIDNSQINTKPNTRGLKASNIRQRSDRQKHARCGQDPHLFPSCTSQWSTVHLDSLRIFYDDFPSPIETLIDMIFNETGMCHPLTDTQRGVVKQLQDRMTFSCDFSDVLDFASISSLNIKPDPNVYEDILKHVEEEGLLCNENASNQRVQDFVTHLLMIIEWMKIKRSSNKILPEAAFQDLFKVFINMCGLIASDGTLWKSEQVFFGQTRHRLTSEVDIAITLRKPGGVSSIDRNLLTLVSIVTVKSYNHIRMESPQKSTKTGPPYRESSGTTSSEGEKENHSEPFIFHQIGCDVLGQHGSEILGLIDKYGENLLSGKKYVYRPGVIVIGTKVTFTLLVCSVKHLLEIKDRSEVDRQRKAIIYYSDQKDLLKKSDRDVLLESFARLKNYCPSK